jgi:hypothetical protein
MTARRGDEVGHDGPVSSGCIPIFADCVCESGCDKVGKAAALTASPPLNGLAQFVLHPHAQSCVVAFIAYAQFSGVFHTNTVSVMRNGRNALTVQRGFPSIAVAECYCPSSQADKSSADPVREVFAVGSA